MENLTGVSTKKLVLIALDVAVGETAMYMARRSNGKSRRSSARKASRGRKAKRKGEDAHVCTPYPKSSALTPEDGPGPLDAVFENNMAKTEAFLSQ